MSSTVLSIGDGDTITVTEGTRQVKVRLACIDAPETSQPPYGMEARKTLRGLLPIGSQVTLRTKATDRYGRSIAEVLKGSTNINQSLVGSGIAFVYWQYINGCDRQTYSRLENDARLKGVGVLGCGVCPVASRDPGSTGVAGEWAVVHLQAVLSQEVEGFAAAKSVPGVKRRNFSGKDTITLIEMVMGRHVSR